MGDRGRRAPRGVHHHRRAQREPVERGGVPRLAARGLTALNATLAVWQHFRGTIDEIAAWHGYFRRHADLLMPVLTVDDIARAKQTGRTGVIFGFQNATPIEDRLDYLSIFHALGVRVIQLAYNDRNYVGDGCLERQRDRAERVRRGGGAGDEPTGDPRSTCRTSATRTSMEAIELSGKPVAITHANPRSLCEHPRNKTDEELRAVAAKGGVVGATIYPRFLRRGSDATIEDVVDVVEHLAGLHWRGPRRDRHGLHGGPAGRLLPVDPHRQAQEPAQHAARAARDQPTRDPVARRVPQYHRAPARARHQPRRRQEDHGRELAAAVPARCVMARASAPVRAGSPA